MSSRTAAWGQPPVSIAEMREGESAWCECRKSASSRVKMSFVTAAMEYVLRRERQSWSIRAVLPEPTGLFGEERDWLVKGLVDIMNYEEIAAIGYPRAHEI